MVVSERFAKELRLASAAMRALVFAGLALAISACATPVGVKHVSIQTAYRLQTESALSAKQPSEPSKTVLRRLGLLDRFDDEPAAEFVVRWDHSCQGQPEVIEEIRRILLEHAATPPAPDGRRS